MHNIYYLLILFILYLIYRRIYETYLPKSIEKYIEHLSAPTTPISQTPILWFDANDPNGTGSPVSPGTEITNWKNKVGSNSFAQAVNGNLDYSGSYPASTTFNKNASPTNPNIVHAGPPATIELKSTLRPINGVQMNDGYFNIKNFF